MSKAAFGVTDPSGHEFSVFAYGRVSKGFQKDR